MTGSGCREDAILSDQKLLHPVCCTDLGYQLHHLWIVVSSISTDDEEASLYAFWNREEDAGDEGFAIIGLLEDFDLLSKTGPGRKSAWSFNSYQWMLMKSQWQERDSLRSRFLVRERLQGYCLDAHDFDSKIKIG